MNAFLLKRLYESFNARAIEAVLDALHPDVDWPNGWEGGRLIGREAVREYWIRQWAEIDPTVVPLEIRTKDDNSETVSVRQTVRAMNGEILDERNVLHTYKFRDGLISQMDIS